MRKPTSRWQVRRGGFTLIELLVVIAIISVLIAMLLPAIQKVREAASCTECQNKLKQMALACHNFHDVYERFPTAVGDPSSDPYAPSDTWMLNILPFVEQQNLYESLANVTVLSSIKNIIPLYYCASDPRPYSTFASPANLWTSYVAIVGLDYGDNTGIIIPYASTSTYFTTTVRVTDVTDGTSNTVMISERPPSGRSPKATWFGGGRAFDVSTHYADSSSGVANGIYGSPLPFTTNSHPPMEKCPAPPVYYGTGPFNVNDGCSVNQIWSLHIGGANFAMGDGSVRFISYSAGSVLTSYITPPPNWTWSTGTYPLNIMGALATRSGGEVVEVP